MRGNQAKPNISQFSEEGRGGTSMGEKFRGGKHPWGKVPLAGEKKYDNDDSFPRGGKVSGHKIEFRGQ